MKVFGFVRQKSAAKFIMADLMDAYKRLGWDYAWLDMEMWKRSVTDSSREKRRDAIETLLTRIREFKPDIIISYGLETFHPLFFDIIEGEETPFFTFFGNTPILCFLFDFGSPFTDHDSIESIPFIRQMQSEQFLFLCWDRDAMKIMQSKGITNCIYFPMGVNEEVFKTVAVDMADRKKYECDFCFVGGPTPKRIRVLESISNRHLKIFGYGEKQWQQRSLLAPRFQYPVFDREKLAKIYNASLTSINVTREHGKSSLNMRVYEAMACGSLLLTDDKEDAQKLFTPDREILIYGDENEIQERAGWIVKNRERARKVARQGRSRILEEHTYYRRIKDIGPVMDRFIKEYRLLGKISTQIAGRNLSDALGSIDAILNSRPNPLNTAFLHLIKFQILKAKGQFWAAKQSLNDSLKANPHFVSAIKARVEISMK